MAKKQLEFDIESVCDEYMDVEDGEYKPKQECEHSLVFMHPGLGKHDVYKCTKCNETITKMWNDTGTTTYKDRV